MISPSLSPRHNASFSCEWTILLWYRRYQWIYCISSCEQLTMGGLPFFMNDIPFLAIIYYNFTKHWHSFVIELNVLYKLSEREKTCDWPLEHVESLYTRISYGFGQGSGEVYISFSECAGGHVGQVGHCNVKGFILCMDKLWNFCGGC